MKRWLNGALLTVWALALGYGVLAFGGAAREYALPFYLLGALLVGLWGVKLLVSRPVSWVWTPLHIPVLAFLGYTVIRYFTAPIEHDARVELLHVLLFGAVYFVAAANFYRPEQRTQLVWVLAVVAFASSVYGFWQFATKSEVVLWFVRPPYGARASGTYICPNHLAGLLAMIFGVLLGRLVVHRSPSRSLQKSFLIKLAEFYVLLFVLAGLYATQSRGGWLAAGVALIGALLWMWRAQALPPRLVDALLLLILVGVIASLSVPSWRTRLHRSLLINLDYTFEYDVLDLKDPSFSGRSGLNATSLGIVRQYPVFGSGPGSWRWFFPEHRHPSVTYTPRYAHNDVLELTAEYGLLGLLLALGVLGCFFWQVWRFTRTEHSTEERAWMIGAATALTAIAVHSFFDFNLHIPANAFLAASLLGLTAAITQKNSPCRRLEARVPARPLIGVVLVLLAGGLAWLSLPLCLAQRQLQAGDDAMAAGEWQVAIEHYQQALQWDRHFPLAHTRLGDVRRRQHADPTAPLGPDQNRPLLAEALAAYQQSLQLNPRDAGVWFRVAVVQEAQRDITAARQAYERAVALDPLNGSLLTRAGRFEARYGRLLLGTELLERAVAVGHPPARLELNRLRTKSKP